MTPTATQVLPFLTALGLFQHALSQDWHFTGVNIARGRVTEQGPGTYLDYGSSRAVDGDTNGDFKAGSCSHTKSTYNTRAYWTVFLDGMYTIKGVRIYAREGFLYRNRNFKVVGNPNTTVFHDDASANTKLYNSRIINIPVSSSKKFNEITFEIPPHTGSTDSGKSTVTLCEVEVYSARNDCSVIGSSGGRIWNISSGTGHIDLPNFWFSSGSTIESSCVDNHILEGESIVECLSNGSFSSPFPRCIEIRCNKPTHIANGDYLQRMNDTYPVGSTLTWACRRGYKSNQHKQRLCMNTTAWSGEEPRCFGITCLRPKNMTNGLLKHINGSKLQSDDISYQESIVVQCDEGFQSEISIMTCTIQGDWTAIPKCIQLRCKPPEGLTGGYYIYRNDTHTHESYAYGTAAMAICDETWAKATEGRLTCGQNGEWIGKRDACGLHTATMTETSSNLLVPMAIGVPVTFMVGFAVGMAVMYLLWKR